MKILDCTLRDGGYYTNWDFDKETVKQYLKAMEALPIDYVEIGYRSVPLAGYYGEYFYLPEFVLELCEKYCPTTKLSIMLNSKDVSINDIDNLLVPCKPYISLVRMAVNPKEMDHALLLARKIKQLGFEIGFNIMYMSTWINLEDFWNKIEATKNLVNYVWLVDSYGGIFPDEIKEITQIVKQKTNAILGFHGHDNLEMAFYNSLTALENGCEIIDTTLTGMGRGAGNLRTELLLTYLAKKGGKVAFNELTEIVSLFEEMKMKYDWGTNLPYMISGMNSLPQKDIMEWMSKKRYSVTNIVHTLQNKSNNEKEQIRYPIFKTSEDIAFNFLVVGGGNSISQHIEAIREFIRKSTNIIVIFTSSKHLKLFDFIKNENVRYLCLIGSEGNRLEQNIDYVHRNDIFILPPYPQKMSVYVPLGIKKSSFEFPSFQLECTHEDSPFQLALEIILKYKKINHVYLIGFDGYATSSTIPEKYNLMKENQDVIDAFIQKEKLLSLTPTQYLGLEVSSVYSIIK